MSTADRVVRMAIAIGIIALYVAGITSGALAIASSMVAYFLIITSIIGYCPVYHTLHLSSIWHHKA